MTTYETRIHIGPDGQFTMRVPPEFQDSDVRVVIERSPPANGLPLLPVVPFPKSVAERTRVLEELAGLTDDPSFQRPPQGEFQEREPLD